ncbi:hypothetical protein IC582_028857 [Cucumis melo]
MLCLFLHTSISDKPFDLIHSDIWGPAPTSIIYCYRYYVLFIDDFSRYTWIYFLKHRFELSRTYIEFANMIRTQFSCPIKTLRTNNALEYKGSTLLSFLSQQGTLVQRFCPHTSNKLDVLSANIATFLTQYVPSFFLPHALRNFGEKQLLHPFILSIVFLPPFFRTSFHSKNYMVLLPTILILKPSVVLALFFCILMNTQNLNHVPASVVFLVMAHNVKVFVVGNPFPIDFVYLAMSHFGSTLCSLSSLGNELAQFAPTLATSDQRSISDGSLEPTPDTLPRRSTRVRESPIHLQDYHCFSTIVALVEPTSYQEASTDPLWQKVMNDELQALEKTHTWDYVDLPPSKRPIGCKWIYKIKTHSDGTIECYKARLVAKGYSQEYGIDYEETFAPVAQMMSVRSLLAVAAVKQCPHDTALFTRHTPQGIVLLLLYVDDIIITGNDPQAISDLQHYLGQHFEMKELRSLNYFLGLEVSRPSDGYLLSQAKYASDLLARLGITDSNTASTSLDPNIHLTLYDGVPLEDVNLYRQLVGSLIYLTVTRQTLHMLFTLLANLWLLLEPSILLPYYISFAISRGLWGMDFSFLLNHLSYYLAILMQIRLGIPLIGVLQQATAST